ncbi:unnamed protein product, partial [Heterosigma akashiwo]
MHPYDGRVVSNFIVQALNNENITVYGDGSQTRSFCYVDDNVEGLIRLMNSDEDRPVNIGNPNEFTILELAQKVIELTGSSSQIVFEPLPGDDPKQRRPDITKAKAVLGWERRCSWRRAAPATVAYFRGLDLRRFKSPRATLPMPTPPPPAAAGRAALARGLPPAPADPARWRRP